MADPSKRLTRMLPARDFAEASALLRDGRLVAFPTETVYGLGARADDARAVAQVFAAKGRPQFNPLIAHVTSLEDALAAGQFSLAALRLAEAFWPGPLTLVVPRLPEAPIADLATAGLPTVALRVPDHALAQAVLQGLGVPVVAPSANPSGTVSPTTAAHVLDGLDSVIDAVLDGGPCPLGLESTILAVDGAEPVLLREGGLPVEDIEAAIGAPLGRPGAGIKAPGMMTSHYSPGARLRLDSTGPASGEAWLGFGADEITPGTMALSLSPSGDLHEAAARLFASLRQLDKALDHNGTIAVAPVPEHGLGRAINDRLRRAAAPRPASITQE